MNSLLYAFTYAERILDLFSEQPYVMENLFPVQKTTKISSESLFLFEEGILQGLVGKYLRKVGSTYIYDPSLAATLHQKIREDLAQCRKIKCVALEEKFDCLSSDVLVMDGKKDLAPSSNPLSSGCTTAVDYRTEDKKQNDFRYYNFMLNAGIIFCGTLSLTALVVTGFALTLSISVPTIEIAIIASTAVLSGLVCYGLFNEKNKQKSNLIDHTPEKTVGSYFDYFSYGTH